MRHTAGLVFPIVCLIWLPDDVDSHFLTSAYSIQQVIFFSFQILFTRNCIWPPTFRFFLNFSKRMNFCSIYQELHGNDKELSMQHTFLSIIFVHVPLGAFSKDNQRRNTAFVLLFAVFDESKSWYGQVEEKRSRENKKRNNSRKEYHTINGYINSTLPGEQLHKRRWWCVVAIIDPPDIIICVCMSSCRFDDVPKTRVLAYDWYRFCPRNPLHPIPGSHSQGDAIK